MTPHWDVLIDETSLAALLPPEQARFSRPIRDALCHFLGGLSESQQESILVSQAGLPPTASFSQRMGLLAQSCPVLHKLGQVLARDQRLAPELRGYLQELESLPPSVSLETIERLLTEELGPLAQRHIRLVPPAIAEASVAVVIPFQETTSGEEVQEGVFKILKPGIVARLEQELQLLEDVGAHLDQRCDALGIPQLDYQEAFQLVGDKLRDEIQLENEQRHLLEAGRFFADEHRVQIPRLMDHCTPRVTSMERVSGDKVTRHGLQTGRRKRRLARLLARTLIAKPIFSKSDQAIFHADPHAGNLFFTDDERLAILDWSLATTLGARERIAIVQIVIGAVTLDGNRIVRVLSDLGDSPNIDLPTLKSLVEASLQQVRRGRFPGLHWLVRLLDQAVQQARLRTSGNMILFRKTLHTLEGVVAEVGDCEGQIDRTLTIEFLRHFAAEWPQRWARLPTSREFSTRLSNLDLARVWISSPLTATRFWTGHALDILEACVQRWEAEVGRGPSSVADSPGDRRPAAPRPQEE